MAFDPSCRARVVIADPHAEFRAAASRLLAVHCDVVETVTSGADALLAVRRHDPDVLVLDFGMPDISGLEVAGRLEAWGVRTRIVFLTLHHEPAIAVRAFASGVAGCVWKCRLVRDLDPAVAAVLGGGRFVSPPQAPPSGGA